jgi:hypothetical protein
LPKEAVFPSPSPMTPEERALLLLARRDPDLLADAFSTGNRLNAAPIQIAPIEIQPLDKSGSQ